MTPRDGARASPADEPRRLADGLDRVLRGLGAPKADALGAIFAGWADLVGEGVAAHARPVSIEKGCLVLAVEEPAWAVQVRYLETDLVAQLGKRLGPGVVTQVRARVTPAPSQG